jgi:hypothetical protein
MIGDNPPAFQMLSRRLPSVRKVAVQFLSKSQKSSVLLSEYQAGCFASSAFQQRSICHHCNLLADRFSDGFRGCFEL